MRDVKSHVENILANYMSAKRELQILEFELQRITHNLDPKDIAEKMFAHSSHERVASSRISDKTADIVIEHFDGQRSSVYRALSTLIYNNRGELQRLDHYLSLLSEDESEVIKLFYFDGLSWEEIVQTASCSLSTLRRRKKKGVDRLAHYYSILNNFSRNNLGLYSRLHFISYIHEERFTHCLQRAKMRSPGIDAMLFIISGCNELWDIGVETFFDFNESVSICYAERNLSLSGNGIKLLRLAYHLAVGMERHNLVNDLWHYCANLEYVDLELAIESIKLALSPEARKLG